MERTQREGEGGHTRVAVGLALEAVSDTEERAIALGARVLEVRPALGLCPAGQQQLCEQQRSCSKSTRSCQPPCENTSPTSSITLVVLTLSTTRLDSVLAQAARG